MNQRMTQPQPGRKWVLASASYKAFAGNHRVVIRQLAVGKSKILIGTELHLFLRRLLPRAWTILNFRASHFRVVREGGSWGTPGCGGPPDGEAQADEPRIWRASAAIGRSEVIGGAEIIAKRFLDRGYRPGLKWWRTDYLRGLGYFGSILRTREYGATAQQRNFERTCSSTRLGLGGTSELSYLIPKAPETPPARKIGQVGFFLGF
jgi:hypothetical protein